MPASMSCPACKIPLGAAAASDGECPSCGSDIHPTEQKKTRSGHRGSRKRHGQIGKGQSRSKRVRPPIPVRKKPSAVFSIYTDGSCRHAGEGGWAFAYHDRAGDLVTRSGSEQDTTNNRMELMSVLRAMEHFTSPQCLNITSDSQYVVKGCQTWMHRWRKNGWKKSHTAPVKNVDLWKMIYAEVERHHSVNLVWVRGHNGNPMNELCDRLASEESLSMKQDNHASNK